MNAMDRVLLGSRGLLGVQGVGILIMAVGTGYSLCLWLLIPTTRYVLYLLPFLLMFVGTDMLTQLID